MKKIQGGEHKEIERPQSYKRWGFLTVILKKAISNLLENLSIYVNGTENLTKRSWDKFTHSIYIY